MRGQDQSKATNGTFSRQAADLALAPRTKVTVPTRSGVAGAKAWMQIDSAGGKPHHEQGRIGFGLDRGDRRGGKLHHEVAEVLLVDHNAVVAFVAIICSGHQFRANGHLSGQPNDASSNLVFDHVGDRGMNIIGIDGVEGAEDEQHFSRSMSGRVK